MVIAFGTLLRQRPASAIRNTIRSSFRASWR